MRLKLALFTLSILFLGQAKAQCPVTAYASPLTVQCGDPISLTAVADGCKPLDNNFNTGVIGSDWSATNGAVVTDGANFPNANYNCVGAPPEGTHCLWMGADVAAPRQVKTNNYNLTDCEGNAVVGANICFVMKFATQAGPDPCEGIDLPEEGVALQYSTNNGATWTNIAYYDPNGGYDAYRTSWNTYCENVPAAALTTATQFRWYQANSSGAGFDTWGLDNMIINLIIPGFTFDWAHDNQGPAPTPNTPDIIGDHDTTLIVTYTNGITTCIDSVSVTVIGTTGQAYADPAEVCMGDQSQLSVEASLIPPLPENCGITVTGCQGTTLQFQAGAGTVNETSYMPLGMAPLPGLSLCLNGEGTHDQSARMQFIVNQNELPAIFLGGQFYNMTLFSTAAAGAYTNFTIKMGCTNKTEFTSNTDFVGNLTTVYGPKNVTIPAGAVLFDFDQHYDYPGGFNVVFEISWCGDVSNKTGNLFKTNTTNFSTIFAHTCSNDCNTSIAATRYQLRPSMDLGVCYRPLPTIEYTWSPIAPLDDASSAAPIATLDSTTTFTVTVSDSARPMCDIDLSVTVSVVSPSVTISPVDPYICSAGGSVSLTANAVPSVPGETITGYSWSPATGLSSTTTATVTANPATTTTYVCTVTDSKGCTSTDTVTVNVGQPPGPTAINGERCGSGTVSLAVSGCGGTVNWYDASTGGTLLFTGNPFTTPSISSTTQYYAACVINGCESVRTTVTASINSASDASFTYNPSSICKTGSPVTPTITGTSGTFSSSPSGLTLNSTTGQITPSSSVIGNYTVTNTVAATTGCPQATATQQVSITAPPVATFNYSGSPYCQSAANPTPNFTGGGQAGTFSSTAGLTFVNVNTGQIDLANSTPGSYTITNTIPAANGCAAVSATFNIVINPDKDASFSYPSNTYCSSGSNPSPTITGDAGGTFSSAPAGLVFTSTSTGTINLGASAVGTYTITYTTPGPCADQQTFTLSVTSNPTANFNYGNAPYCQTAANPNPTFTNGGIPGTFTASPAGLVFVDANTGQVDLAASTPGTYTVTNTVSATGCTPATATANITITAPKNANFSYPQTSYCQTDTDPAVVLDPGAEAGAFSASPAGLTFVNSAGTIDLSATAANTYTITNTLAAQNGCPAVSATFNVTVNPTQNPNFSYSSGTYCVGTADPTPTISGNTGGTFSSSPAGLVFSNPANGTVDLTNSAAGTYRITYSLPAPCPASSSVNLTITNSVAADFDYNDPYCLNEANPLPTFINGGSAGTFSATPAGMTFANASTGEINLAGSTAGTYTVTNTIDPSSGCPAVTYSETVVLDPTDDATFNYSSTTYCSNDATQTPTNSGTAGGAYTATPAGLNLNGTTGEIDLAASTAGAYVIKYVTSGNCPDSSEVNLEIFDPNAADFVYPSTPYCADGANPVPTFQNGGIAGTFTEATGNIIFVSSSTGEINLSASTPGVYTIRNTVASNGACPSVFFESTVEITAPFSANFNYPASPYCLDGTNPTVVLAPNATSGTFTTSDPGITILNANTGEIDLTNSTAGTYNITNTVPAGGGCPSVNFTAPITLSTPALAGFQYPANPYCQTGGSATVTLNPGESAGTFSSNGAGLVVNSADGTVDLTNSNTGNFIVYNSVDPANGCPVQVDSANISINSEFNADFDFDPSYCADDANPTPIFPNNGQAGTFSATPAGLTFVSTSTGEVDMNNTVPGTYAINNFIAANGGCPSSSFDDTITINAVDDAGFSYSQAFYCTVGTDPTPTITGTPGGLFTFTPNGLSINNSTGTIDLDNSVETSYAITYTTNGACPVDSTVAVDIIDAPVADFVYNPASYCVSDPNPSPQFINGGTAGTFSAAPAGLIFVDNQTGEINLGASNPNNYNITNTIAPANGCPGANYTTTISIAAIPDAEFSYPEDTLCQNEQNPTVQHSTGTSGTYSAPAGLAINPSTGTIDMAASSAGTYTVQNVVNGTGSCPNDTAYFTITIHAMPTVQPSDNGPICSGEDLELYVQTQPVSPNTVFSWSGPNSFNSATQNPIISPASTANSGDYLIQITTNGCTSFATLTNVTVNPTNPVDFGPHGPYCPDDNAVNLTCSNTGGTWSGTGISDPNLGTFDPAIGTGNYMITYTNYNGCFLDSVEVIVKDKPVIDFAVFPGTGCAPLDVSFSSNGTLIGDDITWSFGNGAPSTSNTAPNLTYANPGCYDVTLTVDRDGCVTSMTYTDMVCVAPQTVANFTANPPVSDISYPKFDFENNSTNATMYYWNFADQGTSNQENPTFIFNNPEAGEYEIMLITDNDGGCSDTAYLTVTLNETLIYFVPNTFTPDGDKFNQTFRPIFTSGFNEKEYNFSVYNRWGELIFESKDALIGWDGTYQNQLCQEGVYTWRISYQDKKSSEVVIETGSINLLR
ncbi:MAG: gliding motility-associated C-terminal domain-containing protein [Crocinitomicaceae bacterium]|jgi:gliding motility-associated-like protein|nr:gliding motility-associated C-terminal domain-containing protein [Crocinitomicaceae bacterium]